jgi:hypothetical protein
MESDAEGPTDQTQATHWTLRLRGGCLTVRGRQAGQASHTLLLLLLLLRLLLLLLLVLREGTLGGSRAHTEAGQVVARSLLALGEVPVGVPTPSPARSRRASRAPPEAGDAGASHRWARPVRLGGSAPGRPPPLAASGFLLAMNSPSSVRCSLPLLF